MTTPRWAQNAANRFEVPIIAADDSHFRELSEMFARFTDIEKFNKNLIALQLRAYRRGQRERRTGKSTAAPR